MLIKEEHEKRMALYKKGYTDKTIGDELYLTKSAITRWRIKNGLPANFPRRIIPPELHAHMLEWWRKGESDASIAKKNRHV